jgi:hypothetical protein
MRLTRRKLFGLTSYWSSWPDLVGEFHADFPAATERAAELDRMIATDATNGGGAEYAALCALALRQSYGGSELVLRDGVPLALLKEISSDGTCPL